MGKGNKENKDKNNSQAFNIEETQHETSLDPTFTSLLSQMKAAKLQATGNGEILFSNRVYDPEKDERI